ncbi:hypothetical protein [Acaryochloris sp. IP29b_bin.137]|uniref:hypothetical protein n=1 Tax=Acaryochloris sp. IP29b_bin.137 TaxID=2969217 RepID=UPI0026030FE5|nr:hypothetical protein [Acaryochloris sp. IP29b_bin.137]
MNARPLDYESSQASFFIPFRQRLLAYLNLYLNKFYLNSYLNQLLAGATASGIN